MSIREIGTGDSSGSGSESDSYSVNTSGSTSASKSSNGNVALALKVQWQSNSLWLRVCICNGGTWGELNSQTRKAGMQWKQRELLENIGHRGCNEQYRINNNTD